MGNFFLRQSVTATDFGVLIINYTSPLPVTAASGEIWDIDGGARNGDDRYKIEAFDSSNALLATLISPLGTDNTLDARPWIFAFTGLSDRDTIKIDFIGIPPTFGTQKIGLAFNNFYPTTDITNPIPEPTTIALLGIGLAGLAGAEVRRRRKKKAVGKKCNYLPILSHYTDTYILQ